MVDTRRLTQLISSVSERLELPDGPLVVGLSGGADSAALAFLCGEAGRETRAVHIDHGLVNSPTLRTAAIQIAEKLNISLDVRDVSVPQGPSPEGQARKVRYREFGDAAGASDRLLTAHTRDDDVETVLLNIIRGTGLRGLGGIPHYRPPNVFRPMLGVTRDETREVASLRHLPFVDDPMNDDLAFKRNVVRGRVIPSLTELNPRLSESIARMAASARSDNSYIEGQSAGIGLFRKDASVSVAIGELLAVERLLADRTLKRMLVLSLGPDNVSAENVMKLWSVANAETGSQQLRGGVTVSKRGPMLVVETLAEGIDEEPVMLIPGHHRVGPLSFDVLSYDAVCQVTPLSGWSAVFAPTTALEARPGVGVFADGELAWVPGRKRMPVAWYEPGSVGYLSVFARERIGWTSNP